MAYRESKLGLMVRLEPAKAATLITAEIKRKKTLQAAAAALGESYRSLTRWVGQLRKSGHMAPRNPEETTA